MINVKDNFTIDTKINITGDADDFYFLRWDTDANFADGYEGTVKFQSGGAIVPNGELTAGNFIHVAGNRNASGGGSGPGSPYPQEVPIDGGGFFPDYWLTTGDPTKDFKTESLSNPIFVGGWYTSTSQFSLTSGSSGVYVAPPEVESVPEPSTYVTLAGLALGLGIAGWWRRRKRVA